MIETSNFAFLKEYDPVFLQLATAAERAFGNDDPNSTLIKLRQFGQAIAQGLTMRGIPLDDTTSQQDLLYRSSREIQPDANIINPLGVKGNYTAHGFYVPSQKILSIAWPQQQRLQR